MKYQLKRSQQLHCTLDTAWRFFSAAKNLSEITPKEMNFRVLTDLKDAEIYEGMRIDYYVSPLFGLKMRWQTEIIQVDPLKSFTDLQQKGPYKYWHHRHVFVSNEDGVLMHDTVDYELPFGLLGNIAHALMVKRKLMHIFDYRHAVLERLFNT